MSRWVPFDTDGAVDFIVSRLGQLVATESDRILLRGDDGIFSVIRYDKESRDFFIFETDFPESAKADVTELKEGDAIFECIDDGPVKSHRPNVNSVTLEMVYFQDGTKDWFGKPQQVTILRGGQWH